MRLLVDTHVLLWLAGDPERIGAKALAALRDPTAEVHVSLVSTWELAIKASLGKLHLPVSLDTFIVDCCADLGAALQLPIRSVHLHGLTDLPYHHGDPFDRLLISQARAENMVLISADKRFDAYGVDRIWQ